MSTSFTRTREQLAAMVLAKLTEEGAGETPEAENTELVYEAIDLRLKEMHRIGVYWRKVPAVSLSFTMSAGATAASATSDILFPIALTINAAADRVELISKLAYAQIEHKADVGPPIKAMWNGSAGFTLWPVPLSTTTASLTYEKIADDTAPGAAPDVDVAMLRWLKDIIAFDLGDEFGINEAKMIRWERASEKAERNIRKLAVERVDITEVAVDDFVPRSESRFKHDWNTG